MERPGKKWMEKKEKESVLSRRRLLKGLGAGVMLASGATATGLWLNRDDSEKDRDLLERQLEDSESAEVIRYGQEFKDEVLTHFTHSRLRFDEVQFVDQSGRPIGEPVRFRDHVVDYEEVNREGEGKYKLSAGVLDSNGIPTEGVAGEWLNYERAIIEEEYGITPSGSEVLNHVKLYNKIKNQTADPELAEAVADGEIASYPELLAYLSEKPAQDGGTISKYEYLKKNIEFGDEVPDEVQKELRSVIPGLCAQESNYNPHVVSKAGAIGEMQILPSTFTDFNQDGTLNIDSFVDQVKVAGQYFTHIYNRLNSKIDAEAWNWFRFRFLNSENAYRDEQGFLNSERAFLRLFVTPLVINSYNAGPDRVAEAVNEYFYSLKGAAEFPEGPDVFLNVSRFGSDSTVGLLSEYGPDASSYVQMVYAKALLMKKLENLQAVA